MKEKTNPSMPVVVDLDGSLIFTDMLYETFIRCIFQKPWIIFFIIPWLLKGKAFLKYQLFRNSKININTLPYNLDLIEYLKSLNTKNLILCTATNQELANKISDELGFFSETMGSSDHLNLAGTNKADALCSKFGEKNFIYVGNEQRDLKIWEKAHSAIVVGDEKLVNQASKVCSVEKVFKQPTLSLKTFFKAIRIHQWAKNAIIFLPLITSHRLTEASLLIACFLSFIAFGLCASATYLINDLSDLDSDRTHWKKKSRPLASGALSIQSGFKLILTLLLSSACLAIYINTAFFLSLCLYTVITLAYSFKLKSLQTVDIIVLAILYTLRIIAGGAATAISPSFWLLTLSMFVFFSLAIVKRISEILKAIDKGEFDEKLSGRGYYTSDVDILRSLATSSGMVSIMVFATYINSDDVAPLYNNPQILWVICPIFGYWLTRILIMSSRGEVDEDPITFALKDKRSWLVGAGIILAIFFAI